MFRNQYDTDVTVWSPQGHLHQIDYAMEAVKQGSACLGLTSKKLVVLCGIKRQNVDLAEHQKKVFKIDDHLGIAVAGLTADGRTLARCARVFLNNRLRRVLTERRCVCVCTCVDGRFMRTESLNHKFVYGSQITIGRLVSDVADSTSTRRATWEGTRRFTLSLRTFVSRREAGVHAVVHPPSVRRGAPRRRRGCECVSVVGCVAARCYVLLTL